VALRGSSVSPTVTKSQMEGLEHVMSPLVRAGLMEVLESVSLPKRQTMLDYSSLMFLGHVNAGRRFHIEEDGSCFPL
jgi:hypothetical protein